MSGKKSVATGVGVGGSSILVIFIILCLTTFATLSTLSARADLRLAEKTAQAAKEYYDADAKAELLLADIHESLPISGAGANAYIQAVVDAAPEAVAQQGEGGNVIVHYTVPINELQELYVELELLPSAPAGEPRCRKNAWQVISIGDWEPESGGFDLWTGDEETLLLLDGLPPL